MQQAIEQQDLGLIRIKAEQLADRLPMILLKARRIVQSISTGGHGRRRAGPGENFWQFRRYQPGEPAASIDWRRSASSDHLYVREREWETAHTFWLWVDLTKSMFYGSSASDVSKAERALTLGLALCELLTQNGEQVGYLGLTRPRPGRTTTSHICQLLMAQLKRDDFTGALPKDDRIKKYSEVILISDFLEDKQLLKSNLERISSSETRGTLIQTLDPIEENLPLKGRTLFIDAEDSSKYDASNVGLMKEKYLTALKAHKDMLIHFTNQINWGYISHDTSHSPLPILSLMHQRISENAGSLAGVGNALPVSPVKRLSQKGGER